MAWLDEESTEGWCWARRGFVVAGVVHWSHRLGHTAELYSNAGVTVEWRAVDLARWWVFSPTTAQVMVTLVWVGLALVLWQRWARWGGALVLGASLLLMLQEAMNWKAYDRLLLWQALCVCLAPTTRRGLPGARYLLTVIYMGLYGLTGWSKVLDEPGWWNGTALASHLVHLEFGQQALGRWLVPHRGVVTVLGIAAVLFEASFPLWVWVRRAQPWLLAVGASFHLGTLLLMDVGPFWIVSIGVYPALLHPTHVERFHTWLRARGAGWVVELVLRGTPSGEPEVLGRLSGAAS